MTAIAWAKYVGIGAAFICQAWFWWHMGGESTRLKVATAQVHTEVQAQTKERHDQVTVAQEAKTYETAAIEPVAAPVARVCYYRTAPAVPSAHPAGSGADAPVEQRSPDPLPAVPGPDIGPPLVRSGHLTDAKVAGLQDYIEHVCQAHAP